MNGTEVQRTMWEEWRGQQAEEEEEEEEEGD